MFIFASRDSMQPSTPTAPRRQNRYTRSSTTSVTQLLSDSCSSLLQRLTSRVRGPSSTVERSLGTTTSTSSSSSNASNRAPATTSSTSSSSRNQHHHHHHHHHHRHRDDTSLLGSARSRLEEKYSSILERKPSFLSGSRHNLRQRDRGEREASPFVREERTLEPSVRRSVLKSPSTILLSEKAYPYVSPVRREKTPCGHERRAHRARRTRDDAGRSNNAVSNSHSGSNLNLTDKYTALRQTLKDSEAYRRYGRHKSGQAESRTRKVRPQARSGKSEQLESSSASVEDPEKTPIVEDDTIKTTTKVISKPTINGDDIPDDPAIIEREAKRKEIQSLIQKYAALDDIYGKTGSTADAIASKYQRKNRQALLSNNNNEEEEIVDEDDFVVVQEQPITTTTSLAIKRLDKKAPIVSLMGNEDVRGGYSIERARVVVNREAKFLKREFFTINADG